jgi:transposase InsO family protein
MPKYELPVVLAVLGLARSTWYYHREERPRYEVRYAHLRRPLERIAREYPEYGYRRVTTELRETYGELRNQKVIRRLHDLWDLPLLRRTRKPRPSGIRRAIRDAGERANLVARLQDIAPLEVIYTDFTELVYRQGRAKAHMIVFLDHATKLVLGSAVGGHPDTELALEAWRATLATLRQLGQAPAERIVHHDQGSVFIGYAWTGQLLLVDGCRLSYALHGPSENPEMESFFGRFKTENHSLLLDADSPADLRHIASRRIDHYNRRRRHSSLGNQAPLTYFHSLRKES